MTYTINLYFISNHTVKYPRFPHHYLVRTATLYFCMACHDDRCQNVATLSTKLVVIKRWYHFYQR